ncbi:hypothetical protein Ciccas_008028 [Cichlidogyrus casuarinus]|uniref:MICOS complex subunit MIC60 n=1 Tax=Cichlidogyrus casuarinus TaxID=1844966 RepID=A0ABD2Q1G2_9PLAT
MTMLFLNNCELFHHCEANPNEAPHDGTKRSFTRLFLKLSLFTLFGTAGALYISKEAREYLTANIAGSDKLLKQLEEHVGGFKDWTSFLAEDLPVPPTVKKPKTVISKIELPSVSPPLEIENKESSSTTPFKHFQEKENLPSFRDIEAAIKEKAESVLETETLLSSDLSKLTSLARNYVDNALSEYKELNRSANDYINKINVALSQPKGKNEGAWQEVAKLSMLYELSKGKVAQFAGEAKEQLHTLQRAVDKARQNRELAGSRVLQDALVSYKELQYQIDSAMLEAKKTEAEVNSTMRHRDNQVESWEQIEKEMQRILKDSQNKKSFEGKTGTSKEFQEVNALLIAAYKGIEVLEQHLKNARQKQQERLDCEIRVQKERFQTLLDEAVKVELANQKNQFTIDRLKWDEETNLLVEEELQKALARHADHLAQMLKLKQEEMQHVSQQKLREAIIQERKQFEQSIRGWTRRMDAIDHVVQGRAELDRISKQAQAFWLAIEALTSAIEFPTPDPNWLKKANEDCIVPKTTGPLAGLFSAIEENSPKLPDSPNSKFVQELLSHVPSSVLAEGVWTASALRERFYKVHTACRRVVYMDHLNPSLWQYLTSWLQSALTFDVSRKATFWAKLKNLVSSSDSGSNSYLIERETDLVDMAKLSKEDQFRILDSAKVAVERGDLLFALQLMQSLQGQTRALGHDWCEAVRNYLETWMIGQALLANASATGITAFQERL